MTQDVFRYQTLYNPRLTTGHIEGHCLEEVLGTKLGDADTIG